MAFLPLIPWFRLEAHTVTVPGFGTATIHPFQLSVLSAIAVGLIVAILFARAQRRSVDDVLSLAVYVVAFGFPISYALDGLFYTPSLVVEALRGDPGSLLGSLGLSMYGGVAGGLAGAWVWRWKTGGVLLPSLDSLAFGAPFGWTIARLGCFATHDHPGIVTDFALAVADYQAGSRPFLPRHDLGLYDAIVLAGIALVFAFLARTPRPPGFFLALLPMLYAPCRFVLDFLRAPAWEGGDIRYLGLTPAQYGSIVFLAIGMYAVIRGRARQSDATQPT
jgi:phosphatidylglycerol:prolipoprotein diacylglycerol transferase